MAFHSPSTKKRVLMQELKHYTSLLAEHEKNKNKDSNCRKNALQKNFKFNSKTSVHSLNTKSSYWNLKNSKHIYSSKHFIKELPAASLSKNLLPHTKNKQFNFQQNVSVNNSLKISPRSKIFDRLSLKSYNKQSKNVSHMWNTISKQSDSSKCFLAAKKDSKKLIGEIMAITHELKLKSKTLGSFCEQRNPSERESNVSKIKSQKVPSKEVREKKNSLLHQTSTNKDKLCSSSNNLQHRADCSKVLSSGNKILHANLLNKKEKKLENSSNKKLSSPLGQKTNMMSDVSTTHSKEANFEVSVKTLLRPLSESRKIKKQNSKIYAFTNKCILKPCQTPVLNRNSSLLLKKFNQLSKTPNKLKSKYKIVNKALSTEKKAATNCLKSLKLSNLRKRSSYKLTNIGIKKPGSSSKISLNSLSLENSAHICVQSQRRKRSSYKLTNIGIKKTGTSSKISLNSLSLENSQHVYSYIKTPNGLRSHLLKHKPAEIHNASGVDSDLLLELAAENITLKLTPRRHLYKSKNRIINCHSIQKKTAKMIKLKYFNPSRNWRYFPAKTFKDFSKEGIVELSKQNKSFTRINRSVRFNKSVSNKFQTSKVHLQNKKIVTLKGEKFIIGSEGKSLKKVKQISRCKKRIKRSSYNKSLSEALFSEKIPIPASKIMANRVLNLSINRMLSASEKKKINKVNTYCMFYNRFGRCNKGLQCPYVHDPSKIAVCTRFLRGTCKNEKCPFSHEINPGKMAICSFFLQDICTNIQCPYRHEKLSPDAKLCKDFVQGCCLKGKECKKAHVLICPKYVQGICKKGKQCAFPHPVAKDKKINSKECISCEKMIDHLSESMGRYFESEDAGNVVRGVVVPRRKTLPEQPSFISLTLEESS